MLSHFSRAIKLTSSSVRAIENQKLLVSTTTLRSFSTIPPDDPQANFKAKPPKELNLDMAKGIQGANMLILRHGVGQQRLSLLASQTNLPLVTKWQRMMEIYLGAQLHVVAALGYETNEQGIMTYTQQLSQFITKCDPATQDEFRAIGRDTWRTMLAIAFDLDEEEISKKFVANANSTNSSTAGELSIVDARNSVHKVATKLMAPETLELIASECAKLPAESDPQIEMGMKHQVIQNVVVNHVYLGGSPSLVEELGFGSGAKGYATMQYVMAFHENDPLCMQYTSSAMIKIWKAAGLDLSNNPQAAKMPMSVGP